MSTVVVNGGFDDMRSAHVRLLQEAAKLGEVHVLLWSDESLRSLTGLPPKFPQAERAYFTGAIRYVQCVTPLNAGVEPDALPLMPGERPQVWVVPESEDRAAKRDFCRSRGIIYHVVRQAELAGFPLPPMAAAGSSGREKVIVTGCYDWLHSGHVRFFEEASALGDLIVALGNDANVEQLKGKGHPMYGQDERQYMVQSIRYVTQAIVSSGFGWMDAAPEIEVLKPEMYAVNEDGDRPDKAEFCRVHGIRYVVLKRMPKPGLPRRQSTDLRGF